MYQFQLLLVLIFKFLVVLQSLEDYTKKCGETTLNLNPCPESFANEETASICWLVIENTTFPPNCPYGGMMPFNDYIVHINTSHLPVWMPVQKTVDELYGFEPFRWVEISGIYGDNFSLNYSYAETLNEKNCMVFHEEGKREAVSCSNKYNAICAYRNLRNRKTGYCKETYGVLCTNNDYNLNSTCVCVDSTRDQSLTKAEFLKSYQNYNYEILTEELCYIGLKNVNGKYLWVNSNNKVDYSYWSPSCNGTNTFGAISSTGWLLVESQNDLNCILYEKTIKANKPSLNLMYNVSHLILEARNYADLYFLDNSTDPFISCFTDSSPTEIFKKIFSSVTNANPSTIDSNSVIYKIPIEDHGPGYYICQGFTFADLGLVQSNAILLLKNGTYCDFVGYFTVKYSQQTNPFSFVENLYDVFINIKKLIHSGFNPRLYKIINIDELSEEIEFNMHFYKTQENNNCVNDFLDLKQILEDETAGHDITLTFFTLIDRCVGQAFNSTNKVELTIPTSYIDMEVYSQEYCVKNDGARFSRKCEGNYIDGAKWSEVQDSCVILDTSIYTDNLTFILGESDDCGIEEIYRISQFYDSLTAVDVQLLTEILLKRTDDEIINPTILLEIIDNVLKVKRSTLTVSQRYFNSTDTIVTLIKVISESTTYNITELSNSNFAVIELDNQGFYLTEDNEIIYLDDNINILELRKNKMVSSALVLSKELYKNLKDVKVLVFIYYNNALFRGKNNMIITSNIYYGLSVSNNPINHPFYVIFNNNDSNDSCVFYNSSTTHEYKGYWNINGKTNDYKTGCAFNFEGNFALADVPNTITQTLNDTLNSNDTIPEKLNKLNDISYFSSQFKPIDILYVSKILELAAKSDVYDIPLTSSIINNILNVPSDVLRESQSSYNATDRILHFIDEIMVKSNRTETIIENNFSVFTANLKNVNMTGLTLEGCESSCSIKTIYETKIENLINVNAAVILSDQLIEQLLQNESFTPKLVVTIYYTNLLFVDKKKQDTSIIFGILLPDFTEAFKGNISVVYNISNVEQDMCAYWNYDVALYPGSWKRESDHKHVSDVSVCEYSHITHFAMLITDEAFDDKYHLLDIITDVCCVLSLLGILGILITGLLFKKWRKNSGNQILLNFVVAISIKIILLYASNSIYQNRNTNTTKCIVFGAILHYSLLSEFCWMLIIAILQFKRFVEVLGGPPKYILVKAYVCGWIIPVIPVCCILIIDPDNYASGKAGLCYPSSLGLYLGVWLPISIILLINIVIFYYIMYNVCYQKTECRDMINHESLFQWRLALLLFFMLGLTWTFGLISQINSFSIFVYLFSITATLQGFIMFLFFILFNKSTRQLYTNTLKQMKYSNSQFSSH